MLHKTAKIWQWIHTGAYKKQTKLFLAEKSNKCDRRILSMKREHFTVWISDLGRIEQNRKHHLTVNISQWTHAGASEKYKTFPCRKSRQINVIFVERAFYRLNERIGPNRTEDSDTIFFSLLAYVREWAQHKTLPMRCKTLCHFKIIISKH